MANTIYKIDEYSMHVCTDQTMYQSIENHAHLKASDNPGGKDWLEWELDTKEFVDGLKKTRVVGA